MSSSGIDGADFARLTRDVLAAELGGQGEILLRGLSKDAHEDPKRFASALYKMYGMEALKYCVMIVKYVDSGKFHPEEEAEDEAVEEDLESLVEEVESSSGQGTETDSSA